MLSHILGAVKCYYLLIMLSMVVNITLDLCFTYVDNHNILEYICTVNVMSKQKLSLDNNSDIAIRSNNGLKILASIIAHHYLSMLTGHDGRKNKTNTPNDNDKGEINKDEQHK